MSELPYAVLLRLRVLVLSCCDRGQDFEKAGSLRDKEMELKAQISSITNKAKESEQAEVESGDNQGPTVTEADIANIVAQWTGDQCVLSSAAL